jgi:hypothetical protein
MRKISVDLIRLAVSGAVIGAVALAANLGALGDRDQLANAKMRIPPPIHAKAISVGAPAMCWTTHEPIDAAAMQEAQTERGAIVQSCASVAPALRRLSEPQRQLAFAL